MFFFVKEKKPFKLSESKKAVTDALKSNDREIIQLTTKLQRIFFHLDEVLYEARKQGIKEKVLIEFCSLNMRPLKLQEEACKLIGIFTEIFYPGKKRYLFHFTPLTKDGEFTKNGLFLTVFT